MLLVMEHWQSVTKLVLVLGTREQNGAALLSGHLDTPGAGHGPTLLPGHQLRLAQLGVDSLALLARYLVAALPVHQLTLALLDLATLLLGHIVTFLGEHIMAPLVISNRFAHWLGHAATLILVHCCALLAGNVLIKKDSSTAF